LRGNRAGRYLFGCIVGYKRRPIRATSERLFSNCAQGYARVAIKDRHKLRNHLKSIMPLRWRIGRIHGKICALAYSIPKLGQIYRDAHVVEYLKKARKKSLRNARSMNCLLPKNRKSLRVTLINVQNEVWRLYRAFANQNELGISFLSRPGEGRSPFPGCSKPAKTKRISDELQRRHCGYRICPA